MVGTAFFTTLSLIEVELEGLTYINSKNVNCRYDDSPHLIVCPKCSFGEAGHLISDLEYIF
jgi:hypothetical protein